MKLSSNHKRRTIEMKKNLFTKCKVAVVFGLTLICLVACKGNSEKDNGKDTTVATENETKYDVDGRIETAKKEVDALEAKLQDESLNQTEINKLASDISTVWDNAMNDIIKALETSVDEDTMKDIEKEQTDWAADKDEKVKEAQASGGSMAAYLGAMKAAELTEERVNELKEYFSK